MKTSFLKATSIFLAGVFTSTLFLLCSCTSARFPGDSGYAELSPQEIEVLIRYARHTALYTANYLPPEKNARERKIIETEEPEIKIYYQGDLYGRATFTWPLGSMQAQVIFTGPLVDDIETPRLRLTYLGDFVTSPKATRQMQENLSPADLVRLRLQTLDMDPQ